MFTSKIQFLSASEIAYSIEPSIKENGTSLSQFRDKILKKTYGDRFDCNNLDSLFKDQIDLDSYVKFEKVSTSVNLKTITAGKVFQINVGDRNSSTIIPKELKKLCKKSPNNVTKVFSDRLFDYVYGIVSSSKFKDIIEQLKNDEELDFFNYIDSEVFYEIFQKHFVHDLFSENGINIDDLGDDPLRLTANSEKSKVYAESHFWDIRIKEFDLEIEAEDDEFEIEFDLLKKLSLKKCISDQIGVHIKNFYNNIDTLSKDNLEQKQKFFIGEFLKYSYLSYK